MASSDVAQTGSSKCPGSLPQAYALLYDPFCFSPCLVQELITSSGTSLTAEGSARHSDAPEDLKDCFSRLSRTQRVSVLFQVRTLCIASELPHTVVFPFPVSCICHDCLTFPHFSNPPPSPPYRYFSASPTKIDRFCKDWHTHIDAVWCTVT